MSYIANTQRTSEKAAANGYAGLDGDILVPAAQLGTGTDVTTKFLRGDRTYQSVAATAGSTPHAEVFGATQEGGSADTYSRNDHIHAMMADPTGGKSMPTGDIVGTSDSQVLTTKTLTTPTLTTPTVNGAKVASVTKTFADTGYTAAVTDYVILVNCAGGATIINLPAVATSTGQLYKIKKIDAVANLTIDGNGTEKIDGAETKVITVQYDAVTIVCDGAAWYIV